MGPPSRTHAPSLILNPRLSGLWDCRTHSILLIWICFQLLIAQKLNAAKLPATAGPKEAVFYSLAGGEPETTVLSTKPGVYPQICYIHTHSHLHCSPNLRSPQGRVLCSHTSIVPCISPHFPLLILEHHHPAPRRHQRLRPQALCTI